MASKNEIMNARGAVLPLTDLPDAGLRITFDKIDILRNEIAQSTNFAKEICIFLKMLQHGVPKRSKSRPNLRSFWVPSSKMAPRGPLEGPKTQKPTTTYKK